MWQPIYGTLLAILLISVRHAVPSLDILCNTDEDCAPQNGICGDYRGVGRQPTCLCRPGEEYDMEYFRCDPRRTTATLHVIPVRVAMGLPQDWRCNQDSKYCWSLTPSQHFGGFIFDKVQALANPETMETQGSPVIAHIPTYLVTWRCTREYEIAQITSGPPRPIPEYCVTCETWCGIHGTCVNFWSCRCDPGWAGPRCDFPTSTLPQLPDPLGWSPCTSDSDCSYAGGACLQWPTGKRCGCNSTTTPTAIGQCSGMATGQALGLVVSSQPWHSLNVSYSQVYATYLSYVLDGVQNVIVSALPIDFLSYNSRLDSVQYHGYRCLSDSCPSRCSNGLGGTDCDKCPQGSSGPLCSALPAVCAERFCSSRGRCRADGGEGCFCDSGFTGQFCQTFVPSPVCPLGLYGLDCLQTAQECRQLRCSGRGSCLTQHQGCACDIFYRTMANCSTRETGPPLLTEEEEGFVGPPDCPVGRTGRFCELVLPRPVLLSRGRLAVLLVVVQEVLLLLAGVVCMGERIKLQWNGYERLSKGVY